MTASAQHLLSLAGRPSPRSALHMCAVAFTILAIGVALASTAQAAHNPTRRKPVAAKPAKAKVVKQVPAKRPERVRVAAQADAVVTADMPVVKPPVKPVQSLSRAEILASDRDRLERMGRHVMVGYHSFSAVKALVEKRAIAGIFITDHNVNNQSAANIKAQIDSLQAIRAEQALPPLIVAADQEGGSVSRLSPPLKRQTSLGRLLKDLPHDAERKAAVEAYADAQAAELQRIGVNLNFAPVVDLNINPNFRDDGETRLRLRAISADPYLVAKVAGWYCDTVAARGIMCTLKHFPGLGRVSRDTHVASGEIAASEGKLELNDWVPFRRVMSKPNAATMLGHVRVGVLDKDVPASYSKVVIGELIRKQWSHDGLLITDDFGMGAITGSKSGIGGAAVKSIRAGTDIVLVSFVEKHFDTVMSALLAADAAGEFEAAAIRESGDRIVRVLRSVADGATKKN